MGNVPNGGFQIIPDEEDDKLFSVSKINNEKISQEQKRELMEDEDEGGDREELSSDEWDDVNKRIAEMEKSGVFTDSSTREEKERVDTGLNLKVSNFAEFGFGDTTEIDLSNNVSDEERAKLIESLGLKQETDFNDGSKKIEVSPIIKEEEKKEDKPKEPIIMPNVDKSVESKLPDVKAAVQKDRVVNAALEETDEIEAPAYMIDLSKMYSIMPCTMRAISYMLLDDVDLDRLNRQRAMSGQPMLIKDTALYIMDEEGVKLVGHGDSYQFYMQLENFVQRAFDGKVNLYKSLQNSDGSISFVECRTMDIDGVRFRLER